MSSASYRAGGFLYQLLFSFATILMCLLCHLYSRLVFPYQPLCRMMTKLITPPCHHSHETLLFSCSNLSEAIYLYIYMYFFFLLPSFDVYVMSSIKQIGLPYQHLCRRMTKLTKLLPSIILMKLSCFHALTLVRVHSLFLAYVTLYWILITFRSFISFLFVANMPLTYRLVLEILKCLSSICMLLFW